jgi:hypothetical protein
MIFSLHIVRQNLQKYNIFFEIAGKTRETESFMEQQNDFVKPQIAVSNPFFG